MTKIIALCGPAGVGKTTLANLLQSHHGYIRLNFARPIKIMIGSLLKWQGVDDLKIRQMLDGDLREEPTRFLSGRTPRHAMQTLGTEWRDMISTNLWVDIWEQTLDGYKKVVVDDMRFSHEAQRVNKLGGTIVVINRPNIEVTTSHISEWAYLNIPPDITILNTSKPIDMLHELEKRIPL